MQSRIHANCSSEVSCSVKHGRQTVHDKDISRQAGAQIRTPRTPSTLGRWRKVLNRRFNPSKPNEVWLATSPNLESGGLACTCRVEDLYSRMVVGWSMADHLAAVWWGCPGDGRGRRLPERTAGHSDSRQPVRQRALPDAVAQPRDDCSMTARARWANDPDGELSSPHWKKEWRISEGLHTRQQARSKHLRVHRGFYNPKTAATSLGRPLPVEFEQSFGALQTRRPLEMAKPVRRRSGQVRAADGGGVVGTSGQGRQSGALRE